MEAKFDDWTIIQIIQALSAAYPAFKLTADTLNVYVARLNYYPPELLKAATVACIDECKFFPTVAEIKDQAAHIYAQDRCVGDSRARSYLEARQQGEFLSDGYSTNLIEAKK